MARGLASRDSHTEATSIKLPQGGLNKYAIQNVWNGLLLLPAACEQTVTYRAECSRVKCKSSVGFLRSMEAPVTPSQ